MFIVKMANHDGNHRCLIEKNVTIALILPSRWQDGAEGLCLIITKELLLKNGRFTILSISKDGYKVYWITRSAKRH